MLLNRARFRRHGACGAGSHSHLRSRTPSRSRLLFRRPQFAHVRALPFMRSACGARASSIKPQPWHGEAVADARDLGHPLSLAFAFQRAGMTMLLLKDIEAARAVVEELHPLAERNKFAWPLAEAVFMHGWLSVTERRSCRPRDDAEGGREPLLRGLSGRFTLTHIAAGRA